MLTTTADVNGRKHRLLVDTSWPGDGVGLIAGGGTAAHVLVTGSDIPMAGSGAVVALGNVQLTHVPIVQTDFPDLRTHLARRTIGADGAIGVGFLRTCAAFVDLENLVSTCGLGIKAGVPPWAGR